MWQYHISLHYREAKGMKRQFLLATALMLGGSIFVTEEFQVRWHVEEIAILLFAVNTYSLYLKADGGP